MLTNQTFGPHRPTNNWSPTATHKQPIAKRAIASLLALLYLIALPASSNETYLNADALERATNKATENANQIVNETNGIEGRIRRAITCGQILFAEGDSWFKYPLNSDIVDQLERQDWIVYSTAHYGDTLESMLYNSNQLSSVYSTFVRIREMQQTSGTTDGSDHCKITPTNGLPKAILLSGGGNEIVGTHLAFLMEHADSSSLYGLNKDIEIGLFRRLGRLLYEYFVSISHLCNAAYKDKCKKIPIFIHGYDYPKATGAGYGWFGITFAGPWIKPAFESKQRLPESKRIIKALVDKFNALLMSTVNDVSVRITNPVCYLDFRNMVGNELADEIHPNKNAATYLAKLISDDVVNFHSNSEIQNGFCKSPPEGEN